ncbi:MAG: GC-type dockerin domain-anchored protein [Planctomycetota bacterium]|nr:GC-type dockerin domain-anchored protein [Planctomycetota bacterium]
MRNCLFTRTHASLLAATLGVASSTALAHNHITVTTASGSAGDKIMIDAGYYPTETMFTIEDGRLMMDGSPAIYDVIDTFASGPFAGWYGGDEILLTADYYYFTGRLDGGDFRWEIANVTPIAGPNATLVWGMFDESFEFMPMCASNVSNRFERSFSTPGGDHNHDQAYTFSDAGIYDVTFIAWDSNGKFADSDPITIRFRVGPACDADFNADGFLDFTDFDDFVSAFEAGSSRSDFNADGFLDFTDFDAFVQAFEAGC